MPDSFRLALSAVRPTQLYLSGPKLAEVIGWFDFEDPNYGALPVFDFDDDGTWYLTDGHTRAFVAHLAGVEELRVEPEGAEFEGENDLDRYRTCIDRCEEADVRSIPDLAGRVLSQERFEERWVERCQTVGND